MKAYFFSLALPLVVNDIGHATAQISDQEVAPPAVQIVGSQSDTDARRAFVAGKILISRKRIEESGAKSVGEFLRREPAVTVSPDGRIGLLGMPGYTQILIDGQRSVGTSIPDLNTMHVESIEIVKTGMAEYGPLGIAGTINIVTRKVTRKTSTSLDMGLANSDSQSSADFALNHNRSKVGSPLRMNVTVSAGLQVDTDETFTMQSIFPTGQPETIAWNGKTTDTHRRPHVEASSNLTWQRSDVETFSFSPAASISGRRSTEAHERVFASNEVFSSAERGSSPLQSLSVPVRWTLKPSNRKQIDLSLRTSFARSQNSLHRRDIAAGYPNAGREEARRTRATSSSVELAYRNRLLSGHDLKLGSTLRHFKFANEYEYRLGDAHNLSLEALGNRGISLERHVRAFVQDEWRMGERLAFNAGLSLVDEVIRTEENLYKGRSKFRLWSPSLHVSQRIGNEDTQQVRFSLTRNFKLPATSQLTTHPTIHPFSGCESNSFCGANTVDTFDRVGNAKLRPERSLGMNLAYEHSLSNDGQLTIEIFGRLINDKIGNEIVKQNVPWADVPRYVLRPTNFSVARSAGINIELEVGLRSLYASAPKVALRGNAGYVRSTVEAIPGPENRLDNQTPWNAKLGATYEMLGLPLKFDIDATWAPAVWIRNSTVHRAWAARQFGLDASASWNLGRDRRLIFGVKLEGVDDLRNIDEYFQRNAKTRLHSRSVSHPSLRIQFQTRL